MDSVFCRILRGEMPARLLLQDEHCVAMLATAPLRPGHSIVFPRLQIDHWIDLPPELSRHLFGVAARLGDALKRAFPCEKVGVLIVGLEVRHAHVHLVPLDRPEDLDLSRQDRQPEPLMMDDAALRIRRALEDQRPA